MAEIAIVDVTAAVYYFNQEPRKWENVDDGLSQVRIYHNTSKNPYRVVAISKKVSGKTPINSAIFAQLQYQKASESFHQWADTRNTYGLNFASVEDAEKFAATMYRCIKEMQAKEQNGPQKAANKTQTATPTQHEPQSQTKQDTTPTSSLMRSNPQINALAAAMRQGRPSSTTQQKPIASASSTSSSASSTSPTSFASSTSSMSSISPASPTLLASSASSARSVSSAAAKPVVAGINLSKGENFALSGLTHVSVGLGWNPNDSQAVGEFPFDLDAACFMLAGSPGGDKLQHSNEFIFYNNLSSPCGSVNHTGDNLQGTGSSSDKETIQVDLMKVPARIQKILFCVQIHDAAARNNQNFGQIRDSYVRVIDTSSQRSSEACKYELEEDFSTVDTVVVGELYRRGTEWKFRAIGRGYQGGFSTLIQLYA